MLAHCHVRPEGKGLEHHSQIPLLHGDHMALPGVNLIIQPNNTAGWFNKASYYPKQGSLAAAGGAKYCNKLRILYIQVNFLEHLGFAEAFCYLLYT